MGVRSFLIELIYLHTEHDVNFKAFSSKSTHLSLHINYEHKLIQCISILVCADYYTYQKMYCVIHLPTNFQ